VTTSSRQIDLSVIVAVYNEDPRNLIKLLERLDSNIRPLDLSYEVVFVNDGSRDIATSALRQIAAECANIKLIELSRNFGQQAAITAGLEHSDGRMVLNMDSDLQDPPELIPTMFQKWKEGYDVVYATRSRRRDRFLKRSTAYLFYRILSSVSSVKIPQDTGDFRLMDRKVVDALASMPEKSRFLRGMIPWLGFKQCGVPLDRDARELGESTYTVKKLLTLAMDGLIAFSAAPLFMLSTLGFILIAGSLLALAAIACTGSFDLTNAQLLFCIALFTGLQIACVGLIAVYLSKTLDEVRQRPTYLVARRLGTGFEQIDEDRLSETIPPPKKSTTTKRAVAFAFDKK
jgi:glycosyltransferase involved in cell wall biosynthesis